MKFLVIGLGSMGKRRIRNLKHLTAGEIIGFDLRADRRDEAAGLHGIEVFGELERAFDAGPQAVVISTPPNLHMGIARLALERGMHFFSEAGTSLEGMKEAAALAASKRLVAAPSCTMRFHPSVRKLKELLDGGAIGRVLAFTHHCGQYLPDWHPSEDYRKFYVSRRETGACREIVPFELTWLNWLVGDEAAQVSALKAKLSDLDCDIDDAYQVLLQYRGGALGHVLVDVLARAPVRHCRLVGELGTLEWSITEKQVRCYDSRTGKWAVHAEPSTRVEAGYSEMSAEEMYIDEMRAFAAAVNGGRPWPNPMQDDIRTLELLLAAEQSAERGNRVTLGN